MPQKRWPVVSVKQTPFGRGIVSLVWNKAIGGLEYHNNYLANTEACGAGSKTQKQVGINLKDLDCSTR